MWEEYHIIKSEDINAKLIDLQIILNKLPDDVDFLYYFAL